MSDYIQKRFEQAKKNELIAKGVAPDEAEKQAREAASESASSGRSGVLPGLGFMALGGAIAGGTYATNAVQGSAVYIVAAGLAVVGAVILIVSKVRS